VRRLIVVEGPRATFEDAVREIEASGARVVRGWWRDSNVVCVGTVESPEHASDALLAVLAGAGVVVEAKADREIVDRLLDDLRHLGEVEYRTAVPDRGPDLSRDERSLLELLGQGQTLGEAAKALHLSRRTADRRLAGAREKLGVSSTAEAIVVATRGGSGSSRRAP
jgi:DNA-binding NarL/FixJ family response regulator